MFGVCERYGVVFAALGDAPSAPPEYFPEWDEPGVRQYHDVPVVVHACGPRIVENFLDMAHFPFVHAGILGAESHTEVRDYTVTAKEDGIEVTNCLFWQPAATPGSTSGADVEYRYRVPHPYVATLSKLPRDGAAGFSLMIMASPLDEEHCRTWMIGAFTDPDVSTEDFLDFNHRILLQDVPDPRIATAAAAPARPDRRAGAEGRSRVVRLPTLARRPRAAVWHQSDQTRPMSEGGPMTHRRPTTTSAACPRSSCTATWRARPARRRSPTWRGSTPSPSRSRIPPSCSSSRSLNQFLSIYDIICASLRTADDFRRITYEALEDGAAAGVRYREMFFSPGFVIRLGVPVETVWEGVQAGVLDARQDLDINCRMILDFDKPTGPAHAMEMAAFAGSVPDRDLLDRHGRRLGGAGHRPRRLRRRVHRGRPPRAAPDDPRRRGRTGREHRHRHPSSSGASASTTASDSSTTPSSPPRSSSARSRSTSARRRT